MGRHISVIVTRLALTGCLDVMTFEINTVKDKCEEQP